MLVDSTGFRGPCIGVRCINVSLQTELRWARLFVFGGKPIEKLVSWFDEVLFCLLSTAVEGVSKNISGTSTNIWWREWYSTMEIQCLSEERWGMRKLRRASISEWVSDPLFYTNTNAVFLGYNGSIVIILHAVNVPLDDIQDISIVY